MRKPKRQIIATPKADVIRVVENHVEFFTVNATGEAGMSVSGSGRFNGVTQQAITKLLQKVENSVTTERLADSLKPIVGKPLTLTTGVPYKNSSILNDNTCAALTEYYAFDAPKPTDAAKNALRGFHRIGLRHFIHQKTGWVPTDSDAVVRRLLNKNTRLKLLLKAAGEIDYLDGRYLLPIVEVAKLHGYAPGRERGALGNYVAKVIRNAGLEPIKERDPHTAGLVNFYPAYEPAVVSAIRDYYARRTAA